MTKDIKFSENCYRYIIRFAFKEDDGRIQVSYFRDFREIDNLELSREVISTINIWGAKHFFSKKETKEVLTACNAIWPAGNGKLCKVYMSAPVEED